jgi:AcrR family transcriptional regulator
MPTPAERRESTRAAVVRAATQALVDGGLAGFTGPEIVRRGEFSHGTIFWHFPTMVDLSAAVVEQVFTGLSDEYTKRYVELTKGPVTLEALVSLLWQLYDHPAVAAIYELYAAARTDPKLHAAIAPMIQAHVDTIDSLGPAILADLTDADPELTGRVVSLAILAMQGLALYLPVASGNQDDVGRLIRTLVQVGEAVMPMAEPGAPRSERRTGVGAKPTAPKAAPKKAAPKKAAPKKAAAKKVAAKRGTAM